MDGEQRYQDSAPFNPAGPPPPTIMRNSKLLASASFYRREKKQVLESFNGSKSWVSVCF